MRYNVYTRRMIETVTIQCKCGRFLRGTIEREKPEPFPVLYHGDVKITVSQIMAICPGCGQVATSPVELSSSPAK